MNIWIGLLLVTGCASYDVQLPEQQLPTSTGQRMGLEAVLIIDAAFTNATASTSMRRYQLGPTLVQYAEHVTSNCFARMSRLFVG